MTAAHHGSTPAAWTGVVLALAGLGVGAAGLVIGNWLVFWLGAALVVASVLVAKILATTGLGSH